MLYVSMCVRVCEEFFITNSTAFVVTVIEFPSAEWKLGDDILLGKMPPGFDHKVALA